MKFSLLVVANARHLIFLISFENDVISLFFSKSIHYHLIDLINKMKNALKREGKNNIAS